MYSVVKRDGRIIEFDKWKISEAMQKAFDALEPKLEELDEMMGEVIGNFRRGLYTLAHSLAHWVFRTFYFFAGRIKTAICFDSYIAVRLAVVICSRVKLLTASFREHAHVYRAVRLFRAQDRGVDDNSDSDIIDYKLHSYILVGSL